MTYMIKTANGWRPFLALNVPCPNSNNLQGVFRHHDTKMVQAQLDARADRFCALMAEGQAKHFNEPLFGVYGEKL